MDDLESFVAEMESSAAQPASGAREFRSLVAEYLPLNRRRTHGDPPLAPAELEAWTELREVLEYHLGSANPPLGGSRRRSLRVPTDLKVRISERGEAVASLHDLSEDGAFIESRESQEPGSRLALEIDPGSGEPLLRLDAVVRWGRELPNMDGPAGVGVEFLNVEDGDFAALGRLVEAALLALGRSAD